MSAGIYGSHPYSRQIITSDSYVSQRRSVFQWRIDWRLLAFVISFLAAASIALGVADVVYTYVAYTTNKCNSTSSPTPNYCDPNVLVWTWVAVGIWGSLPVFLFGLAILCWDGMVQRRSRKLTFLAFLVAAVFTPAIVVLSALEVNYGVGVFYWTASSLPSDDVTKAALPIAIAVLGAIEHALCVIAFFSLCCDRHNEVEGVAYGAPSQPVVGPNQCQQSTCQQGGGSQLFKYSTGACTARPTSYNSPRQCGPNPAYAFYRT